MIPEQLSTAHPSKLRDSRYLRIAQEIARAVEDIPHLRNRYEDPQIFAARFVIAADGSRQAGMQAPWYMARQQDIEREEGGREEVVRTIAGLALALLGQDPTLSINEVTLMAGNEWRKSIRPQYDYRSGDRPAESIEHLEDQAQGDRNWGDLARDRVHLDLGLVVQHPADIEAGDLDERWPAVEAAVAQLPEHYQEALRLWSNGVGPSEMARIMGMNDRANANDLRKRALRKLQKILKAQELAA